jgi:hypothetical protein
MYCVERGSGVRLPVEKQIPIVQQFRMEERDEVFHFIREAFAPQLADRFIAQWRWKCESSPHTFPLGPAVYLMRLGDELVSLAAGFRVKMWMAGTICDAEALGQWAVHPRMRGRNLWTRAQIDGAAAKAIRSPMLFGWNNLPYELRRRLGVMDMPVRPLVRILDSGPLLAHFAHSRTLGKIGGGVTAAARLLSAPLHRTSDRGGKVVRLDTFDDRVDALWGRARRPNKAMIIRDQRYLKWRYRDRPDAEYLMYGYARGAELDAYLVARLGIYENVRWGYLVDFLAPEDSRGVLRPLIDEAVNQLRRDGAAGVLCHVNDKMTRAELFRRGFFPLPQRNPVLFGPFFTRPTELKDKFVSPDSWYVTRGDGDLELSS